MATIGLDKLYYAKITEDDQGNETYATPTQLAKAMTADLSVELAEATLYADDGAAEIVKEFKSGTLSLGVDDLGGSVASDLTGSTIDNNGVVISAAEDGGTPVAVGFGQRSPMASTAISGCTESSLASPPPPWLPRVTALPSLRPPSKARSFAGTSRIPRVRTPGKPRSPKAMLPSKQKPLPTGTRMCMSLPLPPLARNKEG